MRALPRVRFSWGIGYPFVFCFLLASLATFGYRPPLADANYWGLAIAALL
jgi:hypothetical protein